jgi:hypothetical protein
MAKGQKPSRDLYILIREQMLRSWNILLICVFKCSKAKNKKNKKGKAKNHQEMCIFYMRANVEEMEYFAHMCFQMQQSKKQEKQKKKDCETTCGPPQAIIRLWPCHQLGWSACPFL